MKFIVALCLFGVALALPQQQNPERFATIVRSDVREPSDGSFSYNFETDNGISAQKEGSPGAEGQSNMVGSFRFRLPDGQIAEFRFIADEFGYRPESNLIPTPHPLPAHALEQIRVAEEQRARGIIFN